ncbi:MAG: hypothetical protein K2M60_08995 [Lachnospiraceae bacterium]|nr:hypothetical protein [Lachnospiraceae bacterium]MDE6252313.1 hypothetical protein [Lachnospiraceae bacterium]
MKGFMKKVTATALAMAIALTSALFAAPNVETVQAASSVRINKYDDNMVLTYKPGDTYTGYYTFINIDGCTSKSQIKNLKSSNKIAKVEAQAGRIKVTFPKKAFKTTITCTVKGKKLKTTLTIKKYTNPLKTFKIDKSTFTSKFSNNDTYRQGKSFKNKKMTLQAKSGWMIAAVYVYNGATYKEYKVYGSKFSKKITLGTKVEVLCYNSKQNIFETLTLYKY